MSRARFSIFRETIRVGAELLVTAGALLLLLAFYLLVWTNVQTGAAQSRLLDEFRAQNSTSDADKSADAPAGLAVMHIPRLGKDWEWVVLEGSDMDTINKGPGHFPGTAMPGNVGNFAIAGHRATHGEPFANLDRMLEGDKIYVETAKGWFTYQVTWSQIVAPTAVEVIAPVAGYPGKEATQRAMTIVTCHPRWGSKQRLVVGAQLIEKRSIDAGPPPALQG